MLLEAGESGEENPSDGTRQTFLREPGQREQKEKSLETELAGRSGATPLGDRREGKGPRENSWWGEPLRDRQDLGSGHRSELDAGAKGGPIIGAGDSMEEEYNGESVQTFLFPMLKWWTRPSMGGNEVGTSCRPNHLKTTQRTLSENTTEFLSFERNILRYAQRHGFAIALLKVSPIRRSDTKVTPEDLYLTGFTQQQIRRARPTCMVVIIRRSRIRSDRIPHRDLLYSAHRLDKIEEKASCSLDVKSDCRDPKITGFRVS